MNTNQQIRSWRYAEEFPYETPSLTQARQQAERQSAAPVAPSVASLLTVLAASTGAEHAVEIGTGCGVSTVALLLGLREGAALTSLDIDAAHSQLTRELLAEAGLDKNHRVRIITGDATDVLPRLSAASYDFAFIDAGADQAEQFTYDALALLEPGGLLVVHDPLAGGTVADPVARDARSVSLRRLLTDVAACVDDVHVSLVFAGSGLYLIYKK